MATMKELFEPSLRRLSLGTTCTIFTAIIMGVNGNAHVVIGHKPSQQGSNARQHVRLRALPYSFNSLTIVVGFTSESFELGSVNAYRS